MRPILKPRPGMRKRPGRSGAVFFFDFVEESPPDEEAGEYERQIERPVSRCAALERDGDEAEDTGVFACSMISGKFGGS